MSLHNLGSPIESPTATVGRATAGIHHSPESQTLPPPMRTPDGESRMFVRKNETKNATTQTPSRATSRTENGPTPYDTVPVRAGADASVCA